jgi:hypothetical protein
VFSQRAAAFGLALGCEDVDDHDELRKAWCSRWWPASRTGALMDRTCCGRSRLSRQDNTPKREGAKHYKIDCNGERAALLRAVLRGVRRSERPSFIGPTQGSTSRRIRANQAT